MAGRKAWLYLPALFEAEQRKLALEPESGEELEALIKKAYATPKPIIERMGKLIK
jgi:hypothetical protein